MLAFIWEAMCQQEAFVALVTVVMLYIFFHDVEVRLPFGRPEEVEEDDTRPTRSMAEFIKGRSLPKKHPAIQARTSPTGRTSPSAPVRERKTSPQARTSPLAQTSPSAPVRERKSSPLAMSHERSSAQAMPHERAPPREGDGALRRGSPLAMSHERKHSPQAASGGRPPAAAGRRMTSEAMPAQGRSLPNAAKNRTSPPASAHERKSSPQGPPRERERDGAPRLVSPHPRLSLHGPSGEDRPESAPSRPSPPAMPKESLAGGQGRPVPAGEDEAGPLSEDVIRMIVKPLPQELAAKIAR